MSEYITQKNRDPHLCKLIRAAQGGDQQAFEALLKTYTPLISSMTAQNGNGIEAASDLEDIRQEAILGFYNALMHYDTQQDKVDFGLYAKLCIRNRLVSHRRAQKHRESLLLVEDEEELDLTEDTENNPVTGIVEEESYRALAALIHNSLSAYENRIWWLYLSGRTAKEIAAQLGKDERSVHNAIYRIRRKLREIIPNPY